MPDITVTLQDAVDEKAIVELQFGDYIRGNDGAQGEQGEQGPIGDVTPEAEAARDAAELAQTAAETAASGAASSATSASTSATNAGNSANAASVSACNAATSETNAGASATSASGSATAAAASATSAAGSATSASTSETNAAASAAAASTSATNAATSEANAAATLANALVKANNLSDLSNIATARRNLGAESYSRVVGQTGANNATTPNTQYDFSAEAVVLRDANGSTVVITNTGVVTNNISTAGPAANGRDQAGAFSASSWIHFYWIFDGTTLATISSITAPTTGPTLPSGYTHWAYICPVRFSAASALLSVALRGATVIYRTINNVLSSGTATSYTSVNAALATLIPPNASIYSLWGEASGTTTAGGVWDALISLSYDGVNESARPLRYNISSAAASLLHQVTVAVPDLANINQQLFYQVSNITGTGTAITLRIGGYSIPNGDR